MGLRITSRILSSRSLTDIRNAQWGINDWRMQLSSGHRVNKPSDDPTAFLRILPLQNDILQSQQYQDNNVLARDVLNTAATALEDGVNIMSEARRIAVQGANGAMNSADRATLAASVEQLLGQMISIGNSKLGDRYLFAGTRTRTEPFVMTGNSFVNYQGDNENGNVTIAPGTDATISSSGQRIFMSSGRDATIFEGTTGVAAGSGTDSGDGIAMLQLEHTGFDALPSGLAAGSSSSSALGNLSITITTGPNAISINGGPSINFTGAETDLEIPTANGSSVFLDMTGFDNTPVAGFPTISEGRASWDGRRELDRPGRLHEQQPRAPQRHNGQHPLHRHDRHLADRQRAGQLQRHLRRLQLAHRPARPAEQHAGAPQQRSCRTPHCPAR
jgi:flagellar hook-associated protein 3 FlgL